MAANKRRSKRLSEDEINDIQQFVDIRSSVFRTIKDLRIDVKPKSENQRKLIQSIKEKDVTICVGPAGSGKTFLSCAQALTTLKTEDTIEKIVIIKSVTPLPGEEVGHLKGDIAAKMDPFMYSFMNNFEKIIGKANTEKLKNNDYIETLPIAYVRGINIDNAIIIVDEVQNISRDNLKTILTRIGNNSRVILLGDHTQIDLKNKKSSSLEFLIKKINEHPNDGIGLVTMCDDDITRHRLTKYFIDIFEEPTL